MTMTHNSCIDALAEVFWRKYLDTTDHVEWLVRREEWERLLARVFEAGFDEGSSGEGDD